MFTTLSRIKENTIKQIERSGWLAWASIVVMTLAFFITTIFLFLAFLSNLFLNSIESKSHIYVFFNAGTKESIIQELNDNLLAKSEIKSIEYTDEQGAIKEFKEVQENKDPQLVENIKENVLPASLGIRLNKIDDAEKIIDYLTIEKENNNAIYDIRFSKESIETIKTLFFWLRMGGGIMVVLLLIVIFLFTLLTVEFRTFSRSEEIEIMQLVGGSNSFIRAPFIAEGAFYGALGAFISSSVIYIIYYIFFVVNKDSAAITFLMNIVGSLPWPQISNIQYAKIILATIVTGGLVGGINSFVAIKKYIK